MPPVLLACLVCVGLPLVLGCGPKKSLSGTVPAAGVVTLDGAPLEKASITLVPKSLDGGARGASGASDTAGKFVFTTLDADDGAFPGNYNVTVSKLVVVGKEPTKEEYEAAEVAGKSISAKYENVLPEKYRSTLSGLSVTIPPAGVKDLKIEVLSK